MAFTRDDLVEEILMNFGGYMNDQELMGTLAQPIVASTTSFRVNGSVFGDQARAGFQPGVIEVDTELIYVGKINPATGDFTDCIRGFRGSRAVSHAVGAQVRDHPKIPKLRVVRAINEVLQSVHPRLYAVLTQDFKWDSSGVYELPPGTTQVNAVGLQGGHDSSNRRSRRWRFVNNDPAVTSGKSLRVYDQWPHCTLSVQFGAQAQQFDVSADGDFEAVTRLPEWCREVVVNGASYRIAGFLDAGLIAERTMEGDLLAAQSPIGQGENLSTYFYQQFQVALAEAEVRLKSLEDVGGVHYETPGGGAPRWSTPWVGI